jgi:putative alpha-1,2-mannosidase
VFNRIGLFPKLTTDLFYLHAPHQPKSVIKLEDARSFTILARNRRPGRIYIASALLNGKPLTTPFLHQADITAGGTLELSLSERPTSWAQHRE